jgi:hypothetical protein
VGLRANEARRITRGAKTRIGCVAMFVYRCPNTGQSVQAWVAEEVPADNEIFQTMACIACRQIHAVNPATGEVLGSDDE